MDDVNSFNISNNNIKENTEYFKEKTINRKRNLKKR